jgi:hypothetical protein
LSAGTALQKTSLNVSARWPASCLTKPKKKMQKKRQKPKRVNKKPVNGIQDASAADGLLRGLR